MFFPYFLPGWWLLIPSIIFVMYAQWKVKSTYQRYSQIPSRYGLTGAAVARRLLDAEGLQNVSVEPIPGVLTDRYDPSSKSLGLSQGVYDSGSVAAVGIVAHEIGHAIQDARGYSPMRLRSTLVPAANFGSMLGPYLIIGGLFFNAVQFLAPLGVLLFGAAVVFQLVTLPVELNASSRALLMLRTTGFADATELGDTQKVLRAAALTYVAAAAAAVFQLLQFLLIFAGGGRRRS
ncbi:MAG: zinc metallopeptidase [Chloroflexota bacterium]